MRIIAGKKRGMKLLGPKTELSRPVTDRVKESLFSVLYKYNLPTGKIVADLFCGVGSMGLEALSRGAQFVAFVEKDQNVITVLEKNIKKAGFTRQSKVIRANAFKIGAPPGFEDRKYALVFVDPPYAQTKDVGADSSLAALMAVLPEQLTPTGIVVVRTHKSTELTEQSSRLKIIERRKWGNMAVTILGRRTDDKQTGSYKSN